MLLAWWDIGRGQVQPLEIGGPVKTLGSWRELWRRRMRDELRRKALEVSLR